MATLRELIIKISANSQSFQTEIHALLVWGKLLQNDAGWRAKGIICNERNTAGAGGGIFS
jgi:hypothetical protein